MALNKFFGLDLGEHHASTSTGAATVGKDVEIAFDSAEVPTRNQLVKLLKELQIYIEQTDFPG